MATVTFEQAFAEGVRRFQAGDLQGAEAVFRQCAAANPKHAPSLANLGVLLLKRGAYADAEPVIRNAVALEATVDSITALAVLLDATGRPQDAETQFLKILAGAPNHVPTLNALADLHRKYCSRPVARASYERAWRADPSNIGAGIEYARLSLKDDPKIPVDVLQQLLSICPHKPAQQMPLLQELLVHKEWYERVTRGLPPQHISAMDELFFTFSIPELNRYREMASAEADKNPDRAKSLAGKFMALFCSRDLAAAQQCLDQINRTPHGHIWDAVSFDPHFYGRLEAMTDEDITRGVPDIMTVTEARFDGRPAVYLSCDYTYFRAFCLPLLRSLADKGGAPQVHMHIMDASDDELRTAQDLCARLTPLRVFLTAEQPAVRARGAKAARSYYHAIRFIRFYQHLRQHGCPLWLTDVDVLFHRAPEALFSLLGDREAAFRARPGRLEPWNQFNACVVGASPTMATGYIRLIAAYIAHFYQRDRLWWGIDQFAMYGAYQYLNGKDRAPTVALLGENAVDYTYEDDGIVWCNSGRNKFLQAQSGSLEEAKKQDPDRAKYIDLFARYAVDEPAHERAGQPR